MMFPRKLYLKQALSVAIVCQLQIAICLPTFFPFGPEAHQYPAQFSQNAEECPAQFSQNAECDYTLLQLQDWLAIQLPVL